MDLLFGEEGAWAYLKHFGAPVTLEAHDLPKRIGELARAAHVQRLILTHIPPMVDRAEKQVSSSIGAQSDIPVSFAEDKMRVSP